MATFEAQVEGLTSLSIDGSSSPNQTELTQFLTDGAKELINILPINLLHLCASEQSFTSGSPQTLNTGKVLYVTRSDGTIAQPCRNILPSLVGRSLDSGDMNAATTTDPIYYIKNNTLDVAPSSGSSVYSEVQYPAVAYGDSNVARFPDEVEYLIPIYASIKSLQNALGSKGSNSDITTALTAMNTSTDSALSTISNVTTSLASANTRIGTAKAEIDLAKIEAAEMASNTDNSSNFETACDAIATELNKVDEIISLANDEFDEVAVEISATSTSPISLARTAAPSIINVGDLNITAVIPSSPSLSTVAYSDATNSDASVTAVSTATASAPSIVDVSSNAPSYTKPTITRVAYSSYTSGLSEADPAALTIRAIQPTAPAINTVEYKVGTNAEASTSDILTPTATAPSLIDVSGNAPSFTKPNVSLDFSQVNTHLDTNEDTELATVKIQQLQAQISEYNANIQNEQAEFNKENSIYQMEFQESVNKSNQDLQIAITNINNQAEELRREAAQELDVSKFNKAQDQVLSLQNSAKGMEELISDNNSKLQKYSSEIQSYQSLLNKEVQEYSKNLERYSLELNIAYTAWAKTEADTVQQYQLDIQNELNDFNKDNARYQTELQEAVTKSNQDLQVAVTNANNQAQELRQEAQQSTEMDKFNKAQDQALNLANAAKQMEDLIADNNSKLQKYSNELQSYQSQVNKNVQEYQQNLDQKLKEFDSSIKLQASYYQEAQARINVGNAFLQEAQLRIAQSQGYATEVNATRLTIDSSYYGWIEKQQQKLQADYDKGLQLLIGQRS